METGETAEKDSWRNIVLGILEKEFPELRLDVVADGRGIAFHEMDKNKIHRIREKIDEIVENEMHGTVSSIRRNRLEVPDNILLTECLEITSAHGQSVILLPYADYLKIQSYGLHRWGDKIDASLNKYFSQKKEAPENEIEAARIISGKYQAVLPVVAGIKPVTFKKIGRDLNEKERAAYYHEIEALSQLSGYLNDLKVLTIKDRGFDVFVVYNPKSVKRIVKENGEFFVAKPFFFDDNTPAEDIVNKIFNRDDALSAAVNQGHAGMEEAVGLLLGFDKNSVLQYAESQRKGELKVASLLTSFNPWGVDYTIADHTHMDFVKLRVKYDRLRKVVETLLNEGLSPLDVFKAMATFTEMDTAQEKTHSAVKEIVG